MRDGFRENKKPNNRLSVIWFHFVGILGLEPRMTGPESVVLPLHHIPILSNRLCFCVCKVTTFSLNNKEKSTFFYHSNKYSSVFRLCKCKIQSIQNGIGETAKAKLVHLSFFHCRCKRLKTDKQNVRNEKRNCLLWLSVMNTHIL